VARGQELSRLRHPWVLLGARPTPEHPPQGWGMVGMWGLEDEGGHVDTGVWGHRGMGTWE